MEECFNDNPFDVCYKQYENHGSVIYTVKTENISLEEFVIKIIDKYPKKGDRLCLTDAFGKFYDQQNNL